MNTKNWRRLNVYLTASRNERAFLRTYDRLVHIAEHVHKIGAALLATQQNVMILHHRLQALERKAGITPDDPQLIVKTNERMQA